MTIAHRQDRGLEAGVDQLVEDEGEKGAAMDRRHGLWQAVHDAAQSGAQPPRQNDRLHQDVFGNICASMIWQMACPIAM